MKFSVACVVLAAFAAAAPVRATVVTEIAATFFRLIKTQTLIKDAETKNYQVLSPALVDIARELHQGLNSDMFSISNGIHNTLVDVNIKIGHITGNATAVVSQIESVASFFNTFNHSNARRDFDMKRKRIKRLLQVTLNMTSVVLGLIDETKEMLGKGVSGPLKMLQLTVQSASDDKLTREKAIISRQQMTINNPPKWFFFFTDYQAVRAAQAIKEQGETTVRRIEQLVEKILNHVKWLEGVCHTIREELDNERTQMSTIYGKISGAAETVIVIVEDNSSSENLSDDDYREGSESLVHVMNQLRDEVRKVTTTRSRRAARQNYNMDRHQMVTDESFSGDFLQQSNRPSWLDKTADNGCYYIYNNRTAGCISAETFDAMKEQYTSLSDKFLEFDGLFRDYDKAWKNVATQVLNASKNTTNQMGAIKFASDLETKKVMWSDDIKKIRDLSANFNAYAETLFSDSNAQLRIRRNKDQKLNEDVTQFVDGIKKTFMDILIKNFNDILGINRQVADILSRVPTNVACGKNEQNTFNAQSSTRTNYNNYY